MAINDFVDLKIKKKLSELNATDQEKVAISRADQVGLPYIDLRMRAPGLDALEMLPLEQAQAAGIAAFRLVGRQLHIALSDPSNTKTLETLKAIDSRNERPVLYVASPNSLQHVYDRYKDLDSNKAVEKGLVNLSEAHLKEMVDSMTSLADFQKSIENTIKNEKQERISKLIEYTLAGAIHFKASDIHIEPESEIARVRYRIDGKLSDVYFADLKTFSLMNSRLKLLSGMKLSNSQTAQDGRFSIDFNKEKIEMRVSLVPGAYGENYVMRILDPAAANVPFEALGMNDAIFAELERALRKPFGMILTTGPTGSGKSTTLYACLKKVYNPGVKIITIEDPVEYHFDGITQTQVETKKGYTFLSGLRAALRQDPDVIMVGEIRDTDTAQVAASAALTGHIVLSTLHTNSAAGAIPRFIDLGVDAKTLGASLSLIMAQRLCRKLCTKCKKQRETTFEESKLITNILGDMISTNKTVTFTAQPRYTIYEANPNGCDACHEGYKGRVGLFEGVAMNGEIEKIAVNGGGERDIREASKNQKIPTMREDGVIKILQGVTSLEEVGDAVDLYEV